MENNTVFGSVEYWQSLVDAAKKSGTAYKKQEIKPTDVHGVDDEGFACYTVHFDF